MIISVYAAMLALFYVFLCLRVISFRREFKVSLGTGEHPLLLRATRVQANFAEYVPLALILIVLAEGQGVDPIWVHGLSLLLVFGRLSHAYGVSQVSEKFIFRMAGMAMTFTSIILSALLLLLHTPDLG